MVNSRLVILPIAWSSGPAPSKNPLPSHSPSLTYSTSLAKREPPQVHHQLHRVGVTPTELERPPQETSLHSFSVSPKEKKGTLHQCLGRDQAGENESWAPKEKMMEDVVIGM